MSPQLDPLSQSEPSLVEKVTDALREAILRGRLRPGESLVQQEIAGQLGVSRQPVREALRRLESEGLLDKLPRRGMVVRCYTDKEIAEIYMLRSVLEPVAAEMVVPRLVRGDLDSLEQIVNQMEGEARRGDGARFVELNEKFHRILYEAADSPRLLAFIGQLWQGYTAYTPIFLPGRALRSVEEHREIVKLLKTRDAGRVAEALCRHIRRAAEDYFAYVRGTKGGERKESAETRRLSVTGECS